MSELLLSAVSTGFLTVRIFKGPWRRNPQYLAAAIAGSVLGALLLHRFGPDFDDDLIVGGVTGVVGSWLAMTLFDAIVGYA
jgi:hypothetical protein